MDHDGDAWASWRSDRDAAFNYTSSVQLMEIWQLLTMFNSSCAGYSRDGYKAPRGTILLLSR